jgi:hypothetical protein
MADTPPDFSLLIPELPRWNNGAGIDAEGWIECIGNFELATGYSLIFWPSFVSFDGYVLREGFGEEALRGFDRQPNPREASAEAVRASVEAVMNHIHIADIHCNVRPTEAQLRYLGRVLKDIHEVKLQRDFPDLRFTVSFNDQPNLDLTDYQLTFWQAVD